MAVGEAVKREVWEAGIPNEISYWRGWLVKHSRRYLKQRTLHTYFGSMIGDKKEVSILDLGSGALPLIGYTWNEVVISLFPTDLLADVYNEMIDELGLEPPQRVTKQDMEQLTYHDNFFDIVHCHNALDHSHNPRKALLEMDRVCKSGGWIYLWHLAHVGKQSGYHNLHLWNIDGADDGDCVIWNREERFLLSEVVPGFQTEVHDDHIPRRHVVISKRKQP